MGMYHKNVFLQKKCRNEYTYDRMNRLVGAVQDGEEEGYAYDLMGNRLKKESVQGTESYHYNAQNQLIQIHNRENTLRYLYDKQGNLLEERGETRRKQYSYDTANRQVSIASSKEDGKIICFLFNRGELHRKIRKERKTVM